MKRTRIVLAGMLLTSTLSIAAAPAASAACPPDDQMPCECGNETLNALWRKVTGRDLFHCPW